MAEVTTAELKSMITEAVNDAIGRHIAESKAIAWDSPDKPKTTGETGKWLDLLYLEHKLFGRDPEDCRLLQYPQVKKALDTSTSGSGLEWVPEGFSDQFRADVQARLQIASLFDRIPMPTKTLTLPAEGDDPTAYLVGENTDLSSTITASTPGTADVTLDAVKIAVRVLSSVEWQEDALPALLNRVRTKMVRAVAKGIDNAILNGDTADPHMDSDVTDSTDVRKAWLGLRAKAVDDGNTVDLSTLNAESLLEVKKLLGDYGMDMQECVWIVGKSAWHSLLMLRDSSGNPLVATVDKYGPQATVITGELGKLFGIPVVYSPYVRENLNASGVYDGTTTDRTVILLAWRPAWVLGDRQTVTVETQRHAGAQVIELVATWRGDFKHCLGNKQTVAMGVNVAT